VILTGPAIIAAMHDGQVVIEPPPTHVGPNSVDLTLGETLVVYHDGLCKLGTYDSQHRNLSSDQLDLATVFFYDNPPDELDSHKANSTHELRISKTGIVLVPGVLYLGHTVESTYTPVHVPQVGGRSSIGRLGIHVHVTAGFGDVGFAGQWTLEIHVIHTVRVYAGMRIAQLWLSVPYGDIVEYAGRYQHSKGVIASRMHEGEDEK